MPHRILRSAGLLALIGAVAAAVLWAIPLWLIGKPDATDSERLTAISNARTGVVAFLVGVGALGTLAYTVRTYRLTRQGQLADRYTKSIEQLGNQDSNVRIGGVYALERIVWEDAAYEQAPVYRQIALDVLSAFVRDRASTSSTQGSSSARRRLRGWADARQSARPGADVLIALGVLRRLTTGVTVPSRLDLSNTNLAGADLIRMDLVDADLRGADLRGAKLNGADLTGADLRGAVVDKETQLYGTVVNHVRLWHGQLNPAWLSEARGTVQLSKRP